MNSCTVLQSWNKVKVWKKDGQWISLLIICYRVWMINKNHLHHDCMCFKLATDHWSGPTIFFDHHAQPLHFRKVWRGEKYDKVKHVSIFWPILTYFDFRLKASKMWAQPFFGPPSKGKTTLIITILGFLVGCELGFPPAHCTTTWK